MRFGGLHKNSLIDFPGKISCVLFWSGCNFDCPYCHNPDLARGRSVGPPFWEETQVFDFLSRRRGLLDGVVLSGGEPTLDTALVRVTRAIKALGYAVKLDTNGSRPGVIRRLIDEGLVDYFAMDIKTDPRRYAPLIRKNADPHDLMASARIILDSGLPHEFRTTCLKPFVDAAIVKNVARWIRGAALYALQRFHPAEVLHPEFFQGADRIIDDGDLSRFKAIAETQVQRCIIR